MCWEEDERLPSNAPSPIDRIKIEEFLERNNGKMASYIEGVIRKAAEADEREMMARRADVAQPPLTPSPPPPLVKSSTTSRVEAMVHKPFEPPALGKNSR